MKYRKPGSSNMDTRPSLRGRYTGGTPSAENMRAFRIPPGVYIKLHCGTWHAGPLFEAPEALDFANLELADTNVTDFNCHNFDAAYSIAKS